jgi:hypothetical protein
MPDPQGLSSDDERSALELVYPEIWENHQAIADFRAKLLALLPTVSGAAIFVLLGRKDKDSVAAIGLFGFAVTFGLFMYDLRGIQDCVELRKRAGKIEAKLGLERGDLSPFRDWPKPRLLGLADEVGASWIVYTAVLSSWLYLAGSGSPSWAYGWSLVLVGVYVLLLLAFVTWFGPRIRRA